MADVTKAGILQWVRKHINGGPDSWHESQENIGEKLDEPITYCFSTSFDDKLMFQVTTPNYYFSAWYRSTGPIPGTLYLIQ